MPREIPRQRLPGQQVRTLYPVSLGCPKNLVDTEIMLAHLTRRGWQVTGDPAGAAVLLVNTCAFITPAVQEAVDTILELARHKELDPAKRLVVTGCLVSRYGQELLSPLPEVDLFVGVNDFPWLADWLEGEVLPPGRLLNRGEPFPYDAPQPRFPATFPSIAYLKIAEGCSHRCTYCTIPAIRGPYRSRPLEALLTEARQLAAAGVKELNLIAQDTTAYGQDWGGRPNLVHLLENLCDIPGFVWIRLLYTHPVNLTAELLKTMARLPQVVPYLDVPLQHAHDDLLRRMGRRYGRALVAELLSRLRDTIPGVALRTTVMVGFPGETEAHFQALLELVAQARFEYLGMFLYSAEEGTPASRFPAPVPRRTARERLRRLKALQQAIMRERLKSLVGTVQPVLVEGPSPESGYLLQGRLAIQAPEIDGKVYITAGPGKPGEIQPVRITRAISPDLVGEVLA